VTHYRAVGNIPPKRHTQHRDAGGALLYEELMGEQGFSAESSLLYHRRLPAAIVASRPWELPDTTATANHPLLPRHLLLHDLFPGEEWKSADVVTGRRMVLGNGDVRISYVAAGETSPYYSNAASDECVFVEAGSAIVETPFGALEVSQGDYVILPRGTTHRWVCAGEEPLRAYCIEANSHIAPPKRHLSSTGQHLETAPYCERDLRAPMQPLLCEGEDVEVYVKHRAAAAGSGAPSILGSVVTRASHPFDVVGWDGCLYPYALNVADFEPLTGRVHQPPPVHQAFEGDGFVVCNFVPRKVDYHPLSIPVPYYHSNVDSDEVIFYCAGNYGARKGSGIGPGSVSLHPAGHTHGPQPGAYEGSIGVERVDELAVMVDTFRPLGLGAAGAGCEDANYAWSWSHGR
jgi:homogentisate 1,2-dioxygenase